MTVASRAAIGLFTAMLLGASSARIPAAAAASRTTVAHVERDEGDDARLVARLELSAPLHTPFVLRATLPIPKGVYPREDGKSPFSIRSHGPLQAIVPAQVEVVSRYPTGEADVVELIAPVELSSDERANSRIMYDVLLLPHDLANEFDATPAVAAFSDGDHLKKLGIRTRDVFGNVYYADLSGDPTAGGFGSVAVLKSGPHERQRRVYSTLVPIGTRNDREPPLPHMMGVHAYVTERTGEDAIGLDLRVNNGAVSGSRAADALESTLGIVYWRSVELVLPQEWRALAQVSDPFLGEPYVDGDAWILPLVKELPGGLLHMMGPQAQFERRLSLFPEGRRARAREANANGGLAFSMRGDDIWSWFLPETARYFAQRDILGSVDFVKRFDRTGKGAVRAQEATDLDELRAGIENGIARGYYVESPAMGWAHPWFVKEQGGVGGEGIATFEGHYAAASGSKEGYTRLALLHRMNVSRQPEAAYDRFGEIVGYHGWLDAEGRIPFDFRTNGGIVMPPFLLPMKGGPPASSQVRAVVERGLRPPYDMGTPFEPDGQMIDSSANLLAWWPHDDQHLIRYTKNTKALVWLGNDAMAKDDLLLSAELYRLMRHESAHIKASWSEGVTLRVWEGIVSEKPHQGIWFGREDAWGIDAMCAAYSVATPAWRTRQRPWFDRMAALLEKGSMPNGLIQRMVNERLLGHTNYTVTQAFECFLLIHALRCMNESVFRGVDDVRRKSLEALALRGLDYLLWGPPWAKQLASWQPDPARPTRYLQGPRQGIAISPNDNYATPPYSDETRWGANYLPPDGLGGGIEYFHPWAALSYAQEISESTAGAGLNNRYLRRTLDCGVAHANWSALLADFAEQARAPWSDNSANWIGLVGKLQSLGVK